MKLQPGDYVSTEGMSEEQYHAVCKAFMEAGAENGEYKVFTKDVCNCVGWGYNGIFHGQDLDHPDWDGEFDRKLTIDQILGSDNTGEPEQMNLQEAYKIMQANCGIEVGDTVRVLREFYDNESGSRVHWDNLIERLVGTTGVVKAAYDDDAACMRVVFKNKEQWSFPFFVLELVKKGKKLPDPLEISSDKHVVFCKGGEINLGIHHLDFDTLEEIYLTAKGVRDGD